MYNSHNCCRSTLVHVVPVCLQGFCIGSFCIVCMSACRESLHSAPSLCLFVTSYLCVCCPLDGCGSTSRKCHRPSRSLYEITAINQQPTGKSNNHSWSMLVLPQSGNFVPNFPVTFQNWHQISPHHISPFQIAHVPVFWAAQLLIRPSRTMGVTLSCGHTHTHTHTHTQIANKQTSSTTAGPDVNSSSAGHQTSQRMFNASRRLSEGTGAQQ